MVTANPPSNRTSTLYNVDLIKMIAAGRWREILAQAGIPAEYLDGKGHPCPKCGGTDRFATHKQDFAQRGAVHCRGCFATGGGDGIASVAWVREISQGEAIKWTAEYLGLPKPGGNGKSVSKRRIVGTYDYTDEAGKLLFQVVRFEPKDFRQRRPKSGGGWNWSVKGVRVVPYRLPELLAEPKRPIVIVEGEKDVDSLARIGIPATCNAGGAGKWKPEHAQCLAGRQVVVLPDNDDPGRAHAQQVAASLCGVAEWVRVVELPGLPPRDDVSDWIAAGGTKDQLNALIESAKEWTPEDVQAEPTPWPELDRLDSRDLPEFPTDALPDVLREWVQAESHATQTPADLPGLLALAVCSATIARRVVVVPRPGWTEPTNLFVAVLLEPGNRKSAVFADAVRPLRDCESRMIEAARSTVAREQSERRRDEARLKRLERLAAEKGDQQAAIEAGELAAELAEQSESVLPRLMVDDATSEKLGMMLAQQGGRIASLSPEGGVFDLMAGLYSKSGIPQFGVYLQGHSGDDLRTDRVGRQSVYVERPALTCGYAIQPAVIAGLAANAAFRGRGLLARFLYAFPRSLIGDRAIAPEPVPQQCIESIGTTIRQLAEHTPEGELRLTQGAQRVLEDWEKEIETMLRDGGELEAMRDWGAKLVGETLRLAAVIHCVKHVGSELQPMDAGTLAKGIEIARYLIPHAEAVLQLMTATEPTADDDGRYLLRWMRRHGLREFSKRDVHQHGKRRFPEADDIDPALSELVQRGYIRLIPQTPKPGRPPSPRYEVRPDVFENENTEKRSQYSQYSDSESQKWSSGSIGTSFQGFEKQNTAGQWGEV